MAWGGSQERAVISHKYGHSSVVVGPTMASPELYSPEQDKPTAVLNGPLVEVVGPDGAVHTYILPRVVRGKIEKGEIDRNVIGVLELTREGDKLTTKKVQEIDIGALYVQQTGEDEEKVPNIEDIRLEDDSGITATGDLVLPERTGVVGRVLHIGEAKHCGSTAASSDGTPRVSHFQLRPYINAEGEIQFAVEDIEILPFTGKNVLPLGSDLLMYRREWTRETEHEEPSKRVVNRNTFSYLKKINGEWIPYGEDSVLPQELIGKDGRYGLVGGEPIFDPITKTYVLLMHELQNVRPLRNARRLLSRFTGATDLLEYALIKVRAQRNDDGTWRFIAVGIRPVVVYNQVAHRAKGLRPKEKLVVYGVDMKRRNGMLTIPVTAGDESIIEVSVSEAEVTNPDSQEWIDISKFSARIAA